MSGRYGTRFGFEFTPTPPGFEPVTEMLSAMMDRPLRPPSFTNPEAGGLDSLEFAGLGMPPSEITLAELLAFEEGGFPADHPLSRINVAPGGVSLPPLWMLGSSGGSADAAGRLGMGYAFAAHFSPAPGRPAIDAYRNAFQPSAAFPESRAIVCVSVICAETDEEADFLSSSQAVSWALFHSGQLRRLIAPEQAVAYELSDDQRAIIDRQSATWIIGGPDKVKAAMEKKRAETGADEIMVTTTMHSYAARRKSFSLIADAYGLGG